MLLPSAEQNGPVTPGRTRRLASKRCSKGRRPERPRPPRNPRPPRQGFAGTLGGRAPALVSPPPPRPIPQVDISTRPGRHVPRAPKATPRRTPGKARPARRARPSPPGGRRDCQACVYLAAAAQRGARSESRSAPPPSRLPILSGGARSSALPGHTQLHSSSPRPRSNETSSPAVHPMAPRAQQPPTELPTARTAARSVRPNPQLRRRPAPLSPACSARSGPCRRVSACPSSSSQPGPLGP